MKKFTVYVSKGKSFLLNFQNLNHFFLNNTYNSAKILSHCEKKC